jgi:hypothetical protein
MADVPAFTKFQVLFIESTGRSGNHAYACGRCRRHLVVEIDAMELPSPGSPPGSTTVGCPYCTCTTLFVMEAPHATRARPARYATATPAPLTPPVADAPAAVDADQPLLTLSEWQAQGVGLDLHPSEAAAIPRRADEAPHRRDEQGRRLYTRAEIDQATALHHGGHADG